MLITTTVRIACGYESVRAGSFGMAIFARNLSSHGAGKHSLHLVCGDASCCIVVSALDLNFEWVSRLHDWDLGMCKFFSSRMTDRVDRYVPSHAIAGCCGS